MAGLGLPLARSKIWMDLAPGVWGALPSVARMVPTEYLAHLESLSGWPCVETESPWMLVQGLHAPEVGDRAKALGGHETKSRRRMGRRG